jgi:hypothetical protein
LTRNGCLLNVKSGMIGEKTFSIDGTVNFGIFSVTG